MENIQRYFLIDYENVHERGLAGFDRLSSGDTVIFFCSGNARNLNLQILAALQQHDIHFQFKNVRTATKNAMDFQLATEVGRLIGSNPSVNKCIIISQDNGLQAVAEYWKAENVTVAVQSCIVDYLVTQKSYKTVNPQPVSQKYKWENHPDFVQAVKNIRLGKARKQELFLIFQKCKGIQDASLRKQRMNNFIVQSFGSEYASELYQAVKSLI